VVRTLGAESMLDEEDRLHYHTLGGLAMHALGRVPKTGDLFERGDYKFEVVDMDVNRVDRLLVSPIRPDTATE
jgi:Hemolysins and related proteins containing CBS domains